MSIDDVCDVCIRWNESFNTLAIIARVFELLSNGVYNFGSGRMCLVNSHYEVYKVFRPRTSLKMVKIGAYKWAAGTLLLRTDQAFPDISTCIPTSSKMDQSKSRDVLRCELCSKPFDKG